MTVIGCSSLGWAGDRFKVTVTSNVDGTEQGSYVILPKGFAAEGSPRPLIVSLHSWSADLEQREEQLEN